VLTVIYFSQQFAVGDDARDECRSIGDALGRTPSSIDRQWRNIDAVYRGKTNFNVSRLIKECIDDYLLNPNGLKQIAATICDTNAWPLSEMLEGHSSYVSDTPRSSDEAAEIKSEFFFLLDHIQYKLFSTGSQGFFVQGKITTDEGRRFQAQTTAILIGSKQNLTVSIVATNDQMREAFVSNLDRLLPKTFASGRTGFFGNFKIAIGSERFQCSMQAVQISINNEKR
jgi:hypothetical protein